MRYIDTETNVPSRNAQFVRAEKGDIPEYGRVLANLGGFVLGGRFDTPSVTGSGIGG
jgi:hypothetical protein